MRPATGSQAPLPQGIASPQPHTPPQIQVQPQPGGAPNPNTSAAFQNGVQWLIGTPMNGTIKWSSYDPETNDIIEEAYQQQVPEVVLTHGVFAKAGPQGYLISFQLMTQTNPANGASRQIKRLRKTCCIFSSPLVSPSSHIVFLCLVRKQ